MHDLWMFVVLTFLSMSLAHVLFLQGVYRQEPIHRLTAYIVGVTILGFWFSLFFLSHPGPWSSQDVLLAFWSIVVWGGIPPIALRLIPVIPDRWRKFRAIMSPNKHEEELNRLKREAGLGTDH